MKDQQAKPQRALRITLLLQIISPRQPDRAYQQYSVNKTIATWPLLDRRALGRWHAVRLGPVPDQPEENRLAMPGCRFHPQSC